MINRKVFLTSACALLLIAIWVWNTPTAATANKAPVPESGQAVPFVQTERLVADDGQPFSQFGTSVAVDGDTMVVGAPYGLSIESVDGFSGPGAVYVYVRNGGGWTFQARLTASDGTVDDRFGQSVAIADDTILVGAHLADIEAKQEQGAAYVFTRSGGTWTEQAQLIANDGQAGDQFGRSVALSGDVALVGVDFLPVAGQPRQGAAYVFARSGNSWSEQARLAASDGASGDQFGFAVALSGSTAIVGARGATINGNILQGAAYVFTYSGVEWSEQAKLTASDGDVGESFGESVAFDGKTMITGAPMATLDGTYGRGAAYVFTGGGSDWNEQAKLVASDFENNFQFGSSVAIDGDTALAGSPYSNVNGTENQGAAYVFTRSDSVWSEEVKLTHGDGEESDSFAASVALGGGTALIGAPRIDVNGNMNQGVAYLFERLQGGFSLYLPALTAD